MLKEFLKQNGVKSQASYVECGYGQVEPNHLSAQVTGQVYAQLPASKDIPILEQGQFVKYDYAAAGKPNGIGEVNFKGPGEWMLVFNEIKLYRTHPDGSKQLDCEFALKADDYQARVYSPYDWTNPEKEFRTRALNGKRLPKDPYDLTGESDITDGFRAVAPESNPGAWDGYPMEKVTASKDIYEWDYNEDPFHKLGIYQEKMMEPDRLNSMVPRVLKTNIGDIMTTNMINVAPGSLNTGDLLAVGTNGILVKAESANVEKVKADIPHGTYETAPSGDMRWQVVRVYTMPDGQSGVKLMRIA